MAARPSSEHAGAACERQASPGKGGGWRLLSALALLILAAPAAAADPIPGDDRQDLRIEQRRVDGRQQSLDRELAPYDRDRLRAPPLDAPAGRVRDGRGDPLAERRVLERRNLDFRQQQIDRQLRNPPTGRPGGR